MEYVIRGGKPLKGEIEISGNKNAVLPCIAAALLTEEEVILENVPGIVDVKVMTEILQELGVEVRKQDKTLTLNSKDLNNHVLPADLVAKLRASILLAGSLLTRLGKVTTRFPGGDLIGKRSIDVHLDGFKMLGAEVKKVDLNLEIRFKGGKRTMKDCYMFLEEASATATENILLASVIGKGEVVVRNCPSEPQIVDLCNMLNSMGAKIEGVGTDTLKINGVEKLHGTKFRVGDDYVELVTYAIASAITKGSIKIKCDTTLDLEPIITILEKFGVYLEKEKDGFAVRSSSLRSVEKVVTNIWPGFPTDLMSVLIVLATQAQGITLCHDWMYEGRMFFVDKLISMGANIIIADPHRVLVYGPSKLRSRDLSSPDIRAGMALVLASLVADGTSTIHRSELIERGYEQAAEKLKSLGANIERIS
jgi:UDP-N-acetylglucosamine 1-carboxyvinyltransferase